MGKYRDHRAPRRRRHDDDATAFSEQSSEPNYFQRPAPDQRSATERSDPVDAEVLWFNASKGFGFVKLADGTEVFLPIRVLEAAGSSDVSEGTQLTVVIGETPRGPQVTQVIEIGETNRTSPAPLRVGGSPPAPAAAEPEIEGTVKWYNSEKGFGFIAPDSGEKDVFVHASALTRAGIDMLAEGQKVFIECGQGKKGVEVRNIRLV